MVDLMMGGDGSGLTGELTDLHFSAVGEAMNQMMGAASTAMSTLFQTRIDISPPKLELVNMADENPTGMLVAEDPLVKVAFRMTIGTLVDSEILQLMPYEFGRKAVGLLLSHMQEAQAAAPAEPLAPVRTPAPQAPPPKPSPSPGGDPGAETVVQPAVFQPLKPTKGNGKDDNLNLILDVPLTLTVELGRTQRQIKDILTLGIGSVVELDKLAGEPVEVLVNGKLIAKGEVVVIDENFGVRITEIVSVIERVSNLQ